MVKNVPANAGDMGSTPGSGRSPEENSNPLQYSCLDSHGQRSLVGYSPRGHKESDTPVQLSTQNSTAAAAAAKSLQSCLTLCDPTDGSPPGSSIHRTLQARILEWVSISFSNKIAHVCIN